MEPALSDTARARRWRVLRSICGWLCLALALAGCVKLGVDVHRARRDGNGTQEADVGLLGWYTFPLLLRTVVEALVSGEVAMPTSTGVVKKAERPGDYWFGVLAYGLVCGAVAVYLVYRVVS